jgi:hypothetical protein
VETGIVLPQEPAVPNTCHPLSLERVDGCTMQQAPGGIVLLLHLAYDAHLHDSAVVGRSSLTHHLEACLHCRRLLDVRAQSSSRVVLAKPTAN